MVGALEVPGIIGGPQTLARGFACLATFRLAAIGLRPGVTIIREEELFATPAQPFSDALHDPVPPGQECNIRNRQGKRGLNAGRRLKNCVEFTDYEEKEEAEEKAFSRRHSGGTFRPPVTGGRSSLCSVYRRASERTMREGTLLSSLGANSK